MLFRGKVLTHGYRKELEEAAAKQELATKQKLESEGVDLNDITPKTSPIPHPNGSPVICLEDYVYESNSPSPPPYSPITPLHQQKYGLHEF